MFIQGCITYCFNILNSHVEIYVTGELRSVINLWFDVITIPHTKNVNATLQGSVNVHRGVLLLVPQSQCISSFVFYCSICIFDSRNVVD